MLSFNPTDGHATKQSGPRSVVKATISPANRIQGETGRKAFRRASATIKGQLTPADAQREDE